MLASWLRILSTACSIVFFSLASGALLLAQNTAPLELQLRETAGIRRFEYPLAVKLPSDRVPAEFRRAVVRDGQRVRSAQVRLQEGPGPQSGWWLDFNIDLLPFEQRTVALEFEVGEKRESSTGRGWSVVEREDEVQLGNDPYITWRVRRSPQNWLASVKVPEFEHVRSEGNRFVLMDRAGHRHVLGSAGDEVEMQILRSGPLAVVIGYQVRVTQGPLADCRSAIMLTFPLAKSWVEIDWRIEDARRAVAAHAIEVAQQLDPPTPANPTLVDYGASTLVYLALAPGQAAELHGGRGQSGSTDRAPWTVLKGAKDQLEPYVDGGSTAPHPAEGWAHVMDRTRCVAAAVANFSESDVLRVDAEGLLHVRRTVDENSEEPTTHTLRTWLHFIGFPPQQTAATSPQSMQASPEVEAHVRP